MAIAGRTLLIGLDYDKLWGHEVSLYTVAAIQAYG